MARKKQDIKDTNPKKPPDENSPDYFTNLVGECVKAYEKLNNISWALDLCRVADERLRAMVLDDAEFKRETKSIYARQRLNEVEEIERLAGLAARAMEGGEGEEEEAYVHPSERKNKKKEKKSAAVDRDMLNMRFRAAQMKRELLAEMAAAAGDAEEDATHMLYVAVAREEFEKVVNFEIADGVDEADLDALVGVAEVISGISGKLRPKRKTAVAEEEDEEDEEDYFDIGPNGEVVER